MRKSPFGEEQINAILIEQERGMATVKVCGRHGARSYTPMSVTGHRGGR